jgi:glycolate oxidase FAD binding subunit
MRPLPTRLELSEAIAAAKGPLRIMGGGTRPVGRPVAGEALSRWPG